MIIGLTGSIATGKSEVARILRQRGIPLFDADAAVHELYADPPVVALIEQNFPGTVSGDRIDRGKLSAAIAGHPEKLARLEQIVHPLVQRRREAFLDQWKTADIIVLDIPLLFETGAEKDVDTTLVIITTPELQRARAMARPGMTAEKLEFIMSRQVPMVEKAARADFVINNSGTLAQLADEVDMVLQQVRSRA